MPDRPSIDFPGGDGGDEEDKDKPGCGKQGKPQGYPLIEFTRRDDERVINTFFYPAKESDGQNTEAGGNLGMKVEPIKKAVNPVGTNVLGTPIKLSYTGMIINYCMWTLPDDPSRFKAIQDYINHTNKREFLGFNKNCLLYGGAEPYTPTPEVAVYEDRYCNIVGLTLEGVSDENTDMGALYGSFSKAGWSFNDGEVEYELTLSREPGGADATARGPFGKKLTIRGSKGLSGTVTFKGPYRGTSSPSVLVSPRLVLKHIFWIDSEKESEDPKVTIKPHGVITGFYWMGLDPSVKKIIFPKLLNVYTGAAFPEKDFWGLRYLLPEPIKDKM